MKKFKTILIVLIVCIISCDYPFFNPQETKPPEVAISAFFTENSQLRIKIDPVVDAFTKLPIPLSIEKVIITNKSTGQDFFPKSLPDSSSIYVLQKMASNPGDILMVTVFIKGLDEPVYAMDTIPDKKPDFRLTDSGLTACAPYSIDEITKKPYASLRLLPCQNKTVSYYEFFVSVISYGINAYTYHPIIDNKVYLESTSPLITSEDYYPSNPIMQDVGPLSLLFVAEENSDSITIDFSYCTVLNGDWDSLYVPNHDLCIDLREVSYAYYKYKTTLYHQKFTINGNGIYSLPSPVEVFSNVYNGTGAFAAYNSLSKTYYIKQMGVLKNGR